MATLKEKEYMPVPAGISLTVAPKSRPFVSPPKTVKVSEVAQLYIDKMSKPSAINSMLDVVESKVPLVSSAEALMLGGVQQGLHTLDAGILVMPVIIEMLQNLAIAHGTEYVIYPDDYDKKVTVSNRVARLAVQKAMKKIEGAEEEEEPEVEEQPKGFMRKRKEVM